MPDQVAFPALGLLAAGLVALALVWPQGEGAPSPAPFGHPMERIDQLQTPTPKPAEVLRGALKLKPGRHHR